TLFPCTPLQEREESQHLRDLIWQHAAATGSQLAWQLLADWEASWPRFVKVVPHDFAAMLDAIAAAEAAGLSGEEAVLAAFEWRTQGKPLPEPATINATND
ncbi:MAG: hypothetical protein KDE34_11290, partial [Anaerolineales bacterium]|nr:hypothetical protein [Anaerolineales bacterium]